MSGKLFRVENANTTHNVTEITGNSFPTANVSSIDFGETENFIVTTFSNFGVESIWLSIDGGSSWENKQGNLPDMPVRWMLVHPENEKQVMLATEIGIWTTLDITAENVEWTFDVEGMANVRVDMLQIRKADNTVLAASHGRGLYTGIWEVEFVAKKTDIQNNNISIFPNPSTGIINIDLIDNQDIIEIKIIDLSGKIVYQNKNVLNQNKINLSEYNKGLYFVNFYKKNTFFTEKIILL